MKKYALILTILVGLLACGKDEVAPNNSTNPTPVDNTVERINYNKPTGNNLILSQRLIGDTTKANTIHRIVDASDGGFYFVGLKDGNNVGR